MADHFWGVNIGGQSPDDVVTGTSTGGTHIELRVTDAVTGMSKNAIVKALKMIEGKIAQGDAPA